MLTENWRKKRIHYRHGKTTKSVMTTFAYHSDKLFTTKIVNLFCVNKWSDDVTLNVNLFH